MKRDDLISNSDIRKGRATIPLHAFYKGVSHFMLQKLDAQARNVVFSLRHSLEVNWAESGGLGSRDYAKFFILEFGPVEKHGTVRNGITDIYIDLDALKSCGMTVEEVVGFLNRHDYKVLELGHGEVGVTLHGKPGRKVMRLSEDQREGLKAAIPVVAVIRKIERLTQEEGQKISFDFKKADAHIGGIKEPARKRGAIIEFYASQFKFIAEKLLARLGVCNTAELAHTMYTDFHLMHEAEKMQSAIPASNSGSLHELASHATRNAIDLCRTHASAICSAAKHCPQGRISEMEFGTPSGESLTLAVQRSPAAKKRSMFASYFSSAQAATDAGPKRN